MYKHKYIVGGGNLKMLKSEQALVGLRRRAFPEKQWYSPFGKGQIRGK